MINFQLEPDSNLTALNNDTIGCDVTPPDETFMNYTDVVKCDCSFCQDSCAKPSVDDHIDFFAGLSWKKVGISYGLYIGATIIFQICVHFVCKKKNQELPDFDNVESGRPVTGRLQN